ncbi:MAG: thioredoxin domain-containing protein [Candidatus Aminicenantes bacterium]
MNAKKRGYMSLEKSNRLINEKSPYLLQHARNPVDWHPWGDEAFAAARHQDKPVFLSIGYSTCHWCHVMEKESFEDPGAATLINRVFIPVKVDREERPDLDNYYMTVCQMMTGRGGWPMTVFLTPEKKPFFAATYIPKYSRFGQTGLMELIPKIEDIWRERREELNRSGNRIMEVLNQPGRKSSQKPLEKSVLDRAYNELVGRFDRENGGFGTAPKFPIPHNINFLLRYWKRTNKDQARNMADLTCRRMRAGGIFDHIGCGFHRYSTDARWVLPHFEKMLYDQALLAIAFLETHLVTQAYRHRKTAEDIFTYVLRDMTSPEGGFYSAEDADSEGREGKFYTWNWQELKNSLSSEQMDFLLSAYPLKKEGNFIPEAGEEAGQENLLYLHRTVSETAARMGLNELEFDRQFEKIRMILFQIREKRPRPLRDDKIMTDWNGLMIAALAKAGRALDRSDYIEAAEKAAVFLWDRLRGPGNALFHRYRDKETAIPGFLDDYAFLTWGLIELYESVFNEDYLEKALEINQTMLKKLWDDKLGGLFFAPPQPDFPGLSRKIFQDGAVPAGQSAAMLNLLRLSRLTADTGLEHKAERISRLAAAEVRRFPSGFCHLLQAVDFGLGPSREVIITGRPEAEDTRRLIQACHTAFIPNAALMLIPPGEKAARIHELADFTKNYPAEDRARAYVCSNYSCRRPVHEAGEMLRLLFLPKKD